MSEPNQKELVVKKVTDFLIKREEVERAYIFGSFTSMDKYHDIDIAVYLKDGFNKYDPINHPFGYESTLIGELISVVKKEVDFIVMNNAGLLIQHRIINKGMLLFCRNDKTRIHYENYIRKLYIDAEHIRNIQNYYLRKEYDNAGY